MAETISVETDQVITPEEFKQFVIDNIDLSDSESIKLAAPMLKALGNNKSFLIETINDDLKELARGTNKNPYTAPSILISQGPGFLVRANIWPLVSENKTKRSFENEILVYGLGHDHNFDFLTLGYWGSGYGTDIFEYDYARVKGYIGESVEITFLEHTYLEEGKVMFYRASKDIHRQLPPKELSASLNLMAIPPGHQQNSQYIFDLENNKILDHIRIHTGIREFIIDLAKILGNDESCGLLEQIGQKHPCQRTRASAIQALTELRPSECERLWRMAESDPSPLIRTSEGRQLLLRREV